MIEIEDRKYLYTLIPAGVTMRIIVVVVMSIIFVPWGIFGNEGRDMIEYWRGVAVLLTIFPALLAIEVYFSKGYRVSYDDEAIYWRPHGFRWNLRYGEDHIMRFEDIEEMFPSVGRTNMSPFEFIEIQRKNWDGSERFFLSRGFLRDHELKELLRFMQTKVPDKFPQDIIDYLEAEPSAREKRVMELTATHFPDGGRFAD